MAEITCETCPDSGETFIAVYLSADEAKTMVATWDLPQCFTRDLAEAIKRILALTRDTGPDSDEPLIAVQLSVERAKTMVAAWGLPHCFTSAMTEAIRHTTSGRA